MQYVLIALEGVLGSAKVGSCISDWYMNIKQGNDVLQKN